MRVFVSWGTIPDMFEKLEYAGGKKYEFEAGGRNFKHENFFEAVIGSAVARKTGLKVGDEFPADAWPVGRG